MRWQRYLLQGKTQTNEQQDYNLVSCSYVLAELNSDKSRRLLIKSLWKHVQPGGMMAIIEHGSPLSFKVIRQIRMMMIDLDDDTQRATKGKPRIIAPV